MVATDTHEVVMRPILCALFGLLLANAVHAEPATPPDTPAGHALAAWLEAVNSGDRSKVVAYDTAYAQTEKNPELRRTAIRNLGITGSKKASGALVEIYNSDKDPEVRKSVVNGLFVQGNASGLVDLARKEQDPAMKKEIVSKLSVMGSKDPAVIQYMMELLNAK